MIQIINKIKITITIKNSNIIKEKSCNNKIIKKKSHFKYHLIKDGELNHKIHQLEILNVKI
jgi:hypothetical protein